MVGTTLLLLSLGVNPAASQQIGLEDGAPDGIERLPFDGAAAITQGPRCITHKEPDARNVEAIDFSLTQGTPVRAVRAGKVVHMDELDEDGHFEQDGEIQILDSQTGQTDVYVHLLRPSQEMYVGKDDVQVGDVIGYSGSTGTEDPHLHFAVIGTQIWGLKGLHWDSFNPDVSSWEDRLPYPVRGECTVDGYNDGVATWPSEDPAYCGDVPVGEGSAHKNLFRETYKEKQGIARFGCTEGGAHWEHIAGDDVVVQHFTGMPDYTHDAAIVHDEGFSDQAYALQGAVFWRWLNSDLGPPHSHEEDAWGSPYGTTGRLNRFEHGDIYWNKNEDQTFVVPDPIRGVYDGFCQGDRDPNCGSASDIGFPLSDPGWYRLENGERRWLQRFEAGIIHCEGENQGPCKPIVACLVLEPASASLLQYCSPPTFSYDTENAGTSQDIYVDPGETFDVKISVRNTGTATWRESDKVRLGLLTWDDQMGADTRYSLNSGETVKPDTTRSWTVPLTAPSVSGVYAQGWRMVREDGLVGWFGDIIQFEVHVESPPPPDVCCLCAASCAVQSAQGESSISTQDQPLSAPTAPLRTTPLPTVTPTSAETATPSATSTPTTTPTNTLFPATTPTETPTFTLTPRSTATPTRTATPTTDTSPPRGSLMINDGAGGTRSLAVVLQLTVQGEESGVTRMRLSHDGTHWTTWESYKPTRPWQLRANEGHHTIYVQYRDGAGNVSKPAKATVTVNLNVEKPSSESYRILSSVTGAGGGQKSSTNYQIQGTSGQSSSVGWSSQPHQTSESFQLSSGYWGTDPSTPISTPTPMARRIVFSSDRGGNPLDVYVMNEDGSNVQQLTDAPGFDGSAEVSPDGEKVVFQSTRTGSSQAYIMKIDGSDVRQLTTECGTSGNPSWSPDGTRIVFECDWNLAFINPDSSGLTKTDIAGSSPDWSPDGTQIAFIRHMGTDGDWEIFTVEPSGSNEMRLTHTSEAELHPVWSPDGTEIAFCVDVPLQPCAGHTMNADGSNRTQLADPADNTVSLPNWSPDDQQMVFVSDRDGNKEIYVMERDGSNQTQLTNSPGRDDSPFWFTTADFATPVPVLNFTALLQGRDDHQANTTIDVRHPGDTASLFRRTVQTDSSGHYEGLVPIDLAPGTYDVYVKGPAHLARKKTVELTTGLNEVDFSDRGTVELLAGDVSGDNQITEDDYDSWLYEYTKYFSDGHVDYPCVDLNGDGFINSSDFRYLALNMGKSGAGGNWGVPCMPPPPKLYLNPRSFSTMVNNIFTVDIMADTGAGPADTVDTYLDFDPDYLEVVDASGAPTTTIEPNTEVFVNTTVNSVDNTAGKIDFSTTKLDGSLGGVFTVATIRFLAEEAVDSTELTFVYSDARESDLYQGGESLDALTKNSTISIDSSRMVLNGHVSVERRGDQGDPRWITELYRVSEVTTTGGIEVYEANSLSPLGVFTATTNANGDFSADLVDIEPGTYDIHVKGSNTLSNRKVNVNIPASTSVDFGTLLVGDSNGDDVVNGADVSYMVPSFLLCSDEGEFRPYGDTNKDGCINGADVSGLVPNFLMSGPVLITESLSIGELLPSGVQLTNGAKLSLSPADSSAQADDMFIMDITADTGAGSADTVDVYIDFDPSYLEVVDESGAPTTTIELNTSVFSNATFNMVHNATGQISLSATKFGDSLTGTFTVATVRLRAKKAISTTGVIFVRSGARVSDLYQSGNPLNAELTNGAVTVTCPNFGDPPGVDTGDIGTVASLWRQPASWPHDCDGDGTITVRDVMCAARYLGNVCP